MVKRTLIFTLSLYLALTHPYASGSLDDLDEGKETWGYVTVRPGAHMFFWLYYTTGIQQYTKRPLVLWLQGGPGASSTGIGNFLEIGPLTPELKNKDYAWTKEVNVLFVDNPVGTGYSYVDDVKLLPTNNTEVAEDLVTFIKGFFDKVPEFKAVPLYIFAESYGGKMGVGFAQALSKAVEQKKLHCELAGVVMADSWISPVDAVASWGPYLYATSLVDSAGKAMIDKKTAEVAAAVKAGKMAESTKLWGEAEGIIERVTNGVNFYNILKPQQTEAEMVSTNHIMQQLAGVWRDYSPDNPLDSPEEEFLYNLHVDSISANLSKFMNGPIKEKLKMIPENVTWGGQSKQVFAALSKDFMTSAVHNVETLLNTTSLKVVVYNGQLDLIVSTPGAQKWVENMHWAGTKQWVESTRKPMVGDDSSTVAFSKSFKSFTFYWLLNVGHMAPIDAGNVMMRVMKEIVGIKKK